MNSAPARNSRLIKLKSRELGFDFCGIAKADFLEEEAPRLESWLKNNMNGEMSYMENHFDMRLDPRKLVPGARSVVSLLYNYTPEEPLDGEYKISRYAYGRDYHKVIRKKLKQLLRVLKEEVGEINGRVFVDSAPVMERPWAAKAGLGWIGKHSLLINKQKGSYFFLAELILDLELEYDQPMGDYCGSCTRCMDACPTDAIPKPYLLDGSKCISYFTIELKESIPEEVKGKFENWIFGCDICQEVCPWNRFSAPHSEPEFKSSEALSGMKKKDWEELTEIVFDELFEGSAIKRTKYEGLKRNIDFVKGQK